MFGLIQKTLHALDSSTLNLFMSTNESNEYNGYLTRESHLMPVAVQPPGS